MVFLLPLVCVCVSVCMCLCVFVKTERRERTGCLGKMTGLKSKGSDSLYSVFKSPYLPPSVALCGCSDFPFGI